MARLNQELSASHSFLDHVLSEDKDKAFVIHFDREVELDQELTSSRQKLQKAIDEIHTPEFSQSGSGGSSNGSGWKWLRTPSHGHGGGTLLYDAVFLASDELMKKQQGRKALIILHRRSRPRQQGRAWTKPFETRPTRGVLCVYCILFADKEGYGNRGGFGGPHMGGMGGRRRRLSSTTNGRIASRWGKKFWSRCPKLPEGASSK